MAFWTAALNITTQLILQLFHCRDDFLFFILFDQIQMFLIKLKCRKSKKVYDRNIKVIDGKFEWQGAGPLDGSVGWEVSALLR